MKTYVTFGQNHRHVIGSDIFDKDCVAVVDGNRERVFEIFGERFCFEYAENEWDESKLVYFPRGYVRVKI